MLYLISLRLSVHLLLVRRLLSNQLFFLSSSLSPIFFTPVYSPLLAIPFPSFIHLLHRLSHCASPLPSSPLITSCFLPSPSPPVFISPTYLSSVLSALKGKLCFNIILVLFLSYGNIVLTAMTKGICHGNTFGLFVVRKSLNGTNNISSVWFKHLVGNLFLWKSDWSRAEKETFIKCASMCHDRAPFNIRKIEKLYYDGTFISFLKSP